MNQAVVPAGAIAVPKALANDTRFEIVRILALGERCVCDLEEALALPQNKISYHLGVLRDAGLIAFETRGKNSSYHLVPAAPYGLGGKLLQAACLTELPETYQTNSVCSRERVMRVLILCTHNSARSQMAEGIARHLAARHGVSLDVHSAGTEATRVKPEAAEVMRELGIDLTGHASKTLFDVPDPWAFDYVITVCDSAAENCPNHPARDAAALPVHGPERGVPGAPARRARPAGIALRAVRRGAEARRTAPRLVRRGARRHGGLT